MPLQFHFSLLPGHREGEGSKKAAALGVSAPVVELLQKAGAEVENRLSHAQYDATTWSARTWMSYSTQQLSVSLQLAVAWEAAKAMGVPGLGAGRDVRAIAGSGSGAGATPDAA